MVLTFYFVDQTILCDHFWKATEQHFHVMLWFLHFWCLDQHMQCEHSLESIVGIVSKETGAASVGN